MIGDVSRPVSGASLVAGGLSRAPSDVASRSVRCASSRRSRSGRFAGGVASIGRQDDDPATAGARLGAARDHRPSRRGGRVADGGGR